MEKGGTLMDLNTYKYEIYKDAKEKEDKKNDAKNVAKSVAGGALATGAGAAAYNEYGKGELELGITEQIKRI